MQTAAQDFTDDLYVFCTLQLRIQILNTPLHLYVKSDQLLETSQSARSATRSEHLWLSSLRSQINSWLRSRSSFTQQSKHIQLGSLLLATDTAHFARAESHTKAGVICPSLALLASSAPWRHIWAPPSGKTLLASLAQNLIPRKASSAHRSHCSLVAPPGGRSGRHQVARHCSLRSRRITYQDRRHLPIARVAR